MVAVDKAVKLGAPGVLAKVEVEKRIVSVLGSAPPFLELALK